MSEAETVPDIPDPSEHHLYHVPRDKLLPFFQQVPALFAAEQAKVAEEYQACLYRTEHDFHESDLRRIESSFGLERAEWGTVNPEAVISRLDGMHYPDTKTLGMIEAVSGMSLQTASYYLHFFHHTYPPFTKAALAGLSKLGIDIPWTKVRDPEIYGLYIAALDELKDRVPFWCVPETNIHLSRIMQAALEGWGR